MRRVGKFSVLVIVLCLLFPIGTMGAEPVSDPLKVLESLELTGRVKSVREEHFDAVRKGEGFVEGSPISWFGSAVPHISLFPSDGEEDVETDIEGVVFESSFDEAGRPLSCKNDAGTEAGIRTTLYTWNGQGQLLTEELPEEKTKTVYTWDKQGRLLEGVTDLEGNRVWRGTMEYDATGNPVRILQYVYDDGKEIPYLTISRTYDDKKRMIREGSRTADDGDEFVEELVYDDAGRLVERRPLGADGRPSPEAGVFRIRYDAAGHRVEESYESVDGKTVYLRQTRNYDADGKVVSYEDRYNDGQEVRRGTYLYDEKKHLAKIDRGSSWETYRCDDRGNWIERIMHIEEGLEILTRRTIEYWP